MIVTTLVKIENQWKSFPEMEAAIAYLRALDLKEFQVGRVAIDGERVFAIQSSYKTMTAGSSVELEGHRKYIDIQFIAAGEEAIGWAPIETIKVGKPYQAENDAWTCVGETSAISWVKLSAGCLAVLYPEDAHAPQHAAGYPVDVKKVVVKVLAP